MAAERSSGIPTGIVAALTFVVGLVLLLFLLRGDDDGNGGGVLRLVDYDPADFEQRVADRLDDVTVRPTAVLRVRASRVRWQDDRGQAFFESTFVTFAVDATAAMRGTVVVRDGVVDNARVQLVQYESGIWNYERPLDPWLGNGNDRPRDGGTGTRFAMRAMRLADAHVTIRLPTEEYSARSLDLQLSAAELSGPGLAAPEFVVSSASGVLELPDTATGRVVRDFTLADAQFRLVDGALAFDIDDATFGTSTFGPLAGVWNPAAGGFGLDARITAREFHLADLPWLRAEAPPGSTGSMQIQLEVLPGDRTGVSFTDLNVATSGSSGTGSLRLILGPGGVALESVDVRVDPLALSLIEPFTGPLPYSGDVRGRISGTGGDISFELQANLTTSPAAEPFVTNITGRLAFGDEGVEVRTVTVDLDQTPLAALRAIAPGLPLAGPVSGTVTLTGAPGAAPIQLDVRLEAGGGVVTVAGMVDLRGGVTRYDVSGELIGVELRRVVQPPVPPVQVHARFDLEGQGTEPSTAVARLMMNGGFTGWASEPGDTLAVVASTDAGLLEAETVRLEVGPIQAVAAGEWRFAGGSGGAIRYALEVASLEPLAPYLPTDPGGQRRYSTGWLRAAGTLSGTLERPRMAGEVSATDFQYGVWAAEALQGEYDAAITDGLPVVRAEFAGNVLRTPTGDFDQATLTVDFSRPTFDISLQAEQRGGGILEFAADGRIEEAGGREIIVRRAELDLEEQRWRLPEPARIAWTSGDAVRVEGLRLEQPDSDGLIELDGVVAPLDQADFAVLVRRLPVGDLLDVVGSDIPLAGRLSLQGQVRGPAETPFVELTLSLAEGSVRDVAVRSVDATVDYSGGVLTLDGIGLLGDSAQVDLAGRVPARMTLGVPPAFELIDDQPIDVRVTTETFPMSTLDPGIRTVQDVAGLLMADIRVGGTPGEPVLDGRIALSEGVVTVTPLDQRYEQVQGSATLSGRELRIDRLTAVSGGTASVEGRMTFADLTNPALDLTATLDGFQPQGVDNEDDAEAYGELELTGTFATPRLTGNVRLDDGAVSLAPFTEGPRFDNQLVGVGESFDALDPGALDGSLAADPPVFVSNLVIRAGDDLWFVTDEVRAQLRGRLTAQTEGRDLTITGTLEGEQGTFNLRAGPVRRRFEIIAANIRFFGSPDPNPALDVTASRNMRLAQDRTLDVRARVTGTLNNPNLALSTGDGSSVPESELLSLLVFGRQRGTLGEVAGTGGQGAFLGDVAAFFGGFDILAEQLAEEVNLPVDYLQIQAGPGTGLTDFGDYYVVAGVEVLDEVYAELATPLGGESELWVFSVDWRIDRQWNVEFSLAPVRTSGIGGSGPMPSDFINVNRQELLVVRRRWTY